MNENKFDVKKVEAELADLQEKYKRCEHQLEYVKNSIIQHKKERENLEGKLKETNEHLGAMQKQLAEEKLTEQNNFRSSKRAETGLIIVKKKIVQLEEIDKELKEKTNELISAKIGSEDIDNNKAFEAELLSKIQCCKEKLDKLVFDQ